MNERDLQVLEQYPFSVNASWRVRGAFLLDSSEGRLLIREFSGSAAKVEKEQQLLAHLKACGHRTDQIIADAEGRLVTVSKNRRRDGNVTLAVRVRSWRRCHCWRHSIGI